ncbi:unnamed protein product [Chrysoparadoxa australica]
MLLITGDETGLLKVIQPETGDVLQVDGRDEQCRERGIVGLTWTGGSTYDRFHAVRACNVVESWDLDKGEHCRLSQGSEEVECSDGSADIVTVQAGSNPFVVAVSTKGECTMVEEAEDGYGEEVKQFPVPGPITAVCGRDGHLAVGGRENDLSVWDVSTEKCSWKARNVPMEVQLQLRVPVWVTTICSLRPSEEGLNHLVTGTAYHQVRIYDTHAKRRPVSSLDHGEYRITAMATTPTGNDAIIGDAAGTLSCLDLRTMKPRRRYVGPAGSIRSIAVHPTLPIVAAVGLDRMLWMFDINSGKLKHKVYLNQRINSVLFSAEEEIDGKGGGEEEEAVEEYEMGSGSSDEGSFSEEDIDDEEDEDERNGERREDFDRRKRFKKTR